MKLVLIFLSVFVAVSHQQYDLRRVLDFPWSTPLNRQIAPIPYFNEYLLNKNRIYLNNLMPSFKARINYVDDEDFQPQFLRPLVEEERSEIMNDENGYIDAQSRVRGFEKPLQLSQQNARFFFNPASTTIRNPLWRTVSLTITSTCTAMTLTSCIPATAFAAAPGNFNPARCRRRRDVELNLNGENEQFPINPSLVHFVKPTAVVETSLERNPRQTKFQISSSILENDIDPQSAESGIKKREQEQLRKGRFYYLWQSFATGTTTTTWSVTSTTITQTFNPVLAANAFLPCLPPGYFVCPGTNNGK